MANVSFRMDDQLKKDAEALFDELGINLTTAYTMFTKACVRNRSLPFELVNTDRFYSAENMAALDRSIKQVDEGKVITKTLDELMAMENE